MSLRALVPALALSLVAGCLSTHRYAGGGGGGGRYRTASVQSDSARGGSYWRHSRYRGAPSPVKASPREESSEAPSAPGGSGGSASTGARHYPASTAPAQTQPASGPSGGQGAGPAVAKGAEVPSARLIIYRGQLVLQVIQLKDAMDSVQKVALGMGAYLQSRANNVLTFRVPVERFQELMKALEGMGEVAGKSIHAEDVTQQYYDLSIRLKAAEAVLARLRALLSQAKNVEESLAIEREMARLLEKIELFKGQLRFLRHHASLSTLTVVFQVKPRYSQPIQSQWRSPFGWVQQLGLWRMMSH